MVPKHCWWNLLRKVDIIAYVEQLASAYATVVLNSLDSSLVAN